MSRFKVEPKSRLDFRRMALQVRTLLGLKDVLYFPVVKVLESLSMMFPTFIYHIVEDDELPDGDHADMDIVNQVMRIKRTVYERACDGKGRDRLTIAHELGHFFTLCIAGFKLQRNFSGQEPKPYEDPEWQANCFAGELLMAAHLIKGMGASEVEQKCGVSYQAAMTQLSKL